MQRIQGLNMKWGLLVITRDCGKNQAKGDRVFIYFLAI